MKLETTHIKDLYVIHPFAANDNRGKFVKKFNSDQFKEFNLDFEIKEAYFSISDKNVIRGMHFQAPPFQHKKVVFVSKGSVLDVVVDIRKSSETFGKCYSLEINEENNLGLFIPEGLAHGFLSLKDGTIMNYLQTTGYSNSHDHGILWDSIPFNWTVENPIVSQRDTGFIDLTSYVNNGSHF